MARKDQREKSMSTDLVAGKERNGRPHGDWEADVVVASAWLGLYLLMLVGTLTGPFLARAAQIAALN